MRTYDPGQVQVLVGGNIISGYADGTFVVVERDEDAYIKHSGTDGDVSRAKTNNKTGTMTLTLAQTSFSNDILDGIRILDELSNDGVVPVMIKDGSGRTLLFAAEAWVRKMPSSEYGNEITDREWVLDLAKLDGKIGGNGS